MAAPPRPRFYDLTTADGTPYHRIARMPEAGLVTSTVVQTCVRYAEAERCRFCAIQEALGVVPDGTLPVKRPDQLAEAVHAAVRLDGVRQVSLTTGTGAGPDRGARYLARCVRAIRAAIGPAVPVQVTCEPPADLAALGLLRAAGTTAIGLNVESLDDRLRRRWLPGKARVPLAQYEAAWEHGVRVFGRDHVSTCLLIGLGERPEDLIEGARRLVARGIHPFVVPLRPTPGTIAYRDGLTGPPPERVALITRAVDALLAAHGLAGGAGMPRRAAAVG
ncbi:radical SAM protein (TIGR04043 family) [Catenuloplanes nepalensis]|uniref:Radical SAM protein (TIGR04043 family) n=1 Tax=Catenuloplanes nepalensis TaxID=587533 RepID=A0ABT9MV87_9ACTN|nr:MSMEG_0568 family radical SAM protein [Catenuloplanes nepalensis]MDP9795340.1 radical SAM protein (TIGR04043 family) [Catenuloplanes nepalensis]